MPKFGVRVDSEVKDMPKFGVRVDSEVMDGRRVVEASFHLQVDAADWDDAQAQAEEVAGKLLQAVAGVTGSPALAVESVY